MESFLTKYVRFWSLRSLFTESKHFKEGGGAGFHRPFLAAKYLFKYHVVYFFSSMSTIKIISATVVPTKGDADVKYFYNWYVNINLYTPLEIMRIDRSLVF